MTDTHAHCQLVLYIRLLYFPALRQLAIRTCVCSASSCKKVLLKLFMNEDSSLYHSILDFVASSTAMPIIDRQPWLNDRVRRLSYDSNVSRLVSVISTAVYRDPADVCGRLGGQFKSSFTAQQVFEQNIEQKSTLANTKAVSEDLLFRDQAFR